MLTPTSPNANLPDSANCSKGDPAPFFSTVSSPSQAYGVGLITRIDSARPRLFCPSAQPDMEDSRVLGVVEGSGDQSRVAYLNDNVAVTPEILALAGSVPATQVLRFAAHCEENKCRHFDGHKCQLATRIVQILPAVVDALPACQIRATCRWYQQEGRAACMRCPQVITQTLNPSEDFARAAVGS